MQYMLLMTYTAEQLNDVPAAREAAAEPESESEQPCWMPWAKEMTARGVVLKDGAQLQPVSTATTVSVVNGEVLMSDGPFAETKEQIVGYDVIDCADLDEAVEAASRHPVAQHGGRIEIRPILATS